MTIRELLSSCIDEILSEDTINATLCELIQVEGKLKNKIEFIDEGPSISDIALVRPRLSDHMCEVTLSEAYCRFLWVFSALALSKVEYLILHEQFKETIDEFLKIIEAIIELNVSSLKDNLEIIKEARRILAIAKFHEERAGYEQMLFKLASGETLNLDDFPRVDLTTLFAKEEVNPVMCYGVVFILLHEKSHVALGHMNKEAQGIRDEEEADSTAFWDMYAAFVGKKKFSANCGILCALFSLLFLNPKIEPDGIHPSEDARILTVYDAIKADDERYTIMLVSLFSYWAELYGIKNFPRELPYTEESVNEIKSFLSRYKSSLS